MRFRFPAWGILILLAGACAAVIGLVMALRAKPEPVPSMLSRLPLDGATVLSVDFRTLRDARLLDLLGGAGGAQEPEYRSFVEQTGFDYQTDLDLALVSFHRDGAFYLLRGRFDWRSLSAYAKRQGGTCLNTLCRMPGSTPQRWISFFPIQGDLMALAVSSDSYAASRLGKRQKDSVVKEIPPQPVWALVARSSLRSDKLPAAVRLLAGPLEDAERIALSLGPRENRIELVLDVTCRNQVEAGSLAGRLRAVTDAVRGMAAKQKSPPEPGQLGAVLASGTFTQKDRRVLARWPLERKFFEALAGRSPL